MDNALLDGLPQPQRLALAYASWRSRAATAAVFALDARLAAVLRGRREPIATQMRLAWWRDMLGRSSDEWPRSEPVLDALRTWRDPGCLASLPDGWEALLADDLSPAVIAEFVDARCSALACLATELGVRSPDDAARAARTWAIADLAANLAAGPERDLVVACGQRLAPPPPLPASLRPLAVLAALGRAALARGGDRLLSGPTSLLLALRIGMVGR